MLPNFWPLTTQVLSVCSQIVNAFERSANLVPQANE